MKKNVGSIDKTIRIVAGLIIFVLGFVHNSWWGLLGLIPLITGLLNSCPLYIPFGISTCKIKTAPEEKKE